MTLISVTLICERCNRLNGKVHVFIGAASLAAFCVAFPTGFDFFDTRVLPEIGLVSAAFGSYLPDIDMGRTHMGMKHKVASKVVSKVGGGHRGVTHSLLVPALFAVAMWAVATYFTAIPYLPTIVMSIIFGAEYGYLCHIIADLFNGKGCPILWPISKSKISLADLPSTGIVPWIFAVIVVAAQFALVLHLGGLF